MYQTQETAFPNTSKFIKNTLLHVIFSTLFSASGSVVKYLRSLSFLIYSSNTVWKYMFLSSVISCCVKNVFEKALFPKFLVKKSPFSQTCLMPWKAQSQKSSRAQRNDAWNTESNILGTQLFTRKLSGNSGSVKQKTLGIPMLTYAFPFKIKLTSLISTLKCLVALHSRHCKRLQKKILFQVSCKNGNWLEENLSLVTISLATTLQH